MIDRSIARHQFACLADLDLDEGVEPSIALKQLSQKLRSTTRVGTLQLTLVDADTGNASTRVSFGNALAPAQETAQPGPTFEVITTRQTWAQIIASALSPLEAFLRGKLRIRGDASLAQDVFEELAATPGITRLCGGSQK